MGIDDIIVTVISILVLLVFVFNPVIRKILVKVDTKQKDSPPREDPAYESVNSYATRILKGSEEKKEIRIIQPDLSVPPKMSRPEKNRSVLSRIEKQNTLKKAVIWKEILSPPPALRDTDHLF